VREGCLGDSESQLSPGVRGDCGPSAIKPRTYTNDINSKINLISDHFEQVGDGRNTAESLYLVQSSTVTSQTVIKKQFACYDVYFTLVHSAPDANLKEEGRLKFLVITKVQGLLFRHIHILTPTLCQMLQPGV